MSNQQRKPGRAPRKTKGRVAVTLSPSSFVFLEVLGEGNISLGIEKLVGERAMSREFLDVLERKEILERATRGVK